MRLLYLSYRGIMPHKSYDFTTVSEKDTICVTPNKTAVSLCLMWSVRNMAVA